MSFLHVFSTVGKDVLKAAPTILKLIPLPAPIAFAASTGAEILNQEINGKVNPIPGEVKKENVIAAVSPLAPEGPDKLDGITKVLEGLVMACNGLAILFPNGTNSTEPKT